MDALTAAKLTELREAMSIVAALIDDARRRSNTGEVVRLQNEYADLSDQWVGVYKEDRERREKNPKKNPT